MGSTEQTAPMSSLLTTIITTSPTPSAPGTELISSVIASFRLQCSDLAACPVIVIFDAYDQIVPKARLKKGYVTADGASNYRLYKDNVKELILKEYCQKEGNHALIHGHGEAEFGLSVTPVRYTTTQTEDKQVTFIEPIERLGFGLAVRSGLRMVKTPYVWIQQHDWVLISEIPLKPLLEIMKASESDKTAPVKYVCFPSCRMLSYAGSAHVIRFPMLRQLTTSLKRSFTPASQPDVSIPLTPLFFWHDKPHVASTAHYLSRVFPTPLAMQRGAFIEDHIGQRARGQMKEGLFQKWACWLYYPDEGKRLCLRHLMGRTWRGSEAEEKKKLMWIERNRLAEGHAPDIGFAGPEEIESGVNDKNPA